MNHKFEAGMFLRESEPNISLGSILFIHGLGESGLCFEHFLDRPELANYHLLVPDLPGYGRSPWIENPLSLDDTADHLAAWLMGRNTGPVVVLGHSMGGVVALLLAERHPRLVSMIIDVDGNKSPADCVFSSQAANNDLQTFANSGFEKMQEKIFHAGHEDAAQRGYYVSLRLCDPRAYHLNSQDLVFMSETESLASRLAGHPVSSVYIAGVPGGASARSKELLLLAGVPLEEISPSGHWPFIDQTDHFVKLLVRLLNDNHPKQS